ncbi:MAG TPA: GAF domain-containing protein [Thermodesulfobacteriota bacterium]
MDPQGADTRAGQANAHLALLARTTLVLLAEEQPRAALRRLCEMLAAHLSLEVYLNYWVTEDGEALRLDSSAGIPDRMVGSVERLRLGEGVCGLVARRRARLVVEDVQATTDPAVGRIRALGVQAYVCCPLVARGRLLGTLAFGTRQRRRFEPDEVELIEAIANQVALAIDRQRADTERAKLLEQLSAANRALERRIAEFQTLFDLIPIGIALAHDRECRYITGNPAFERMLGMPPGSNLSKSAPPTERPPFRLYRDGRELAPEELPMQMAAARGVSVSDVELDVVWPDGTMRKLLEWAAPVFDEAGEVCGCFLAVADITERKRMEDALRASEARYRLAARAMNDVIWDWNIDTGEMTWNEALTAVLGYTPEEAGTTIERARAWWAGCLHPDDRARLVGSLERAIDDGQEVWSAEYRVRRADGSYAAVVDRAYIARDDRGRAVRAVGSMLDVTARRQAEEEQRFLAEASTVLASTLDHEATLAGIARLVVPRFADWCVVDLQEPSGLLRHVAFAHSDPARQALGERLRRYPPKDNHILGKVLREGRPVVVSAVTDSLLADGARDAEHLELLRSMGLRSLIAVPLVARGHSLGAISFLAAESGRRYEASDLRFAEELAHRAALAIDNVRLYQEAQEAIRTRDTFLARASHELRTPLTSVLASIRLLKHALADRSKHPADELLEMASRNTAAMLALINDLLDASKLAAGETPLAFETVALADIVLASKEVVQAQAREKDIVLRSDVPASLVLRADPLRLIQVFTNLVANAVKFTPTGGEVTVEAEAVGGEVVIRVRDTGEGIAAEHLERIFEPFAQARNARRLGARGTGLGLAICRQIVNLHGGRIWAESDGPGHGSVFVIRLPAAENAGQAA